ncbi:hypothetical protein JM93_03635 [Roseibium hamelinense]|uniref:Probable membrane transporter protein n=1 Tax=Roseibium hamelinense TaxID=150831 RepID=A0A562SLT7_9HYPH|nr:sulfite exporter TauE/SafE family protein [Roseibium hamelinense]MTI45021.1 sulfite exporter TauE/SafE family protein [Roseibium hamelinense]TWI82285.1 hypothetical protein JM93_03635 [Roseibium hamelinense]
MTPILDPWFYAAAIPAVFVVGLSKGGFGGTLAMLGVPAMALVISPIQAAGIMLPILVVMDGIALLAYRGRADWLSLRILLPAAIAGICIGWLTATYVNDGMVVLLVGILSLLFVADYVFERNSRQTASKHNPLKGGLWGTIAGFTSFVSHTGGPPFQLYVVPLRLEPALFAGTAVIFFAAVNAMKLVPYYYLDQFDATNIATSLVLLPIAPIATLCGVWLVKKIDTETFYRLIYALMLLIGCKLIFDGIASLT